MKSINLRIKSDHPATAKIVGTRKHIPITIEDNEIHATFGGTQFSRRLPHDLAEALSGGYPFNGSVFLHNYDDDVVEEEVIDTARVANVTFSVVKRNGEHFVKDGHTYWQCATRDSAERLFNGLIIDEAEDHDVTIGDWLRPFPLEKVRRYHSNDIAKSYT